MAGSAWAAPVSAPLSIKPVATHGLASPDAPGTQAPSKVMPSSPLAAASLTAAPSVATEVSAPAVDRQPLTRLDLALPATTDDNGANSPAPASLSRRTLAVMQSALALLGTPYRWGGTDPDNGLDCSGLVGYVFRSTLGLDLPRISRDLARAGQPILSRDQITPGDLVFFGLRGRVNHVGIYLGEGRFLHAPRRGEDVRIDNFNSRYWQARYMGARRVGL